jgi:hypothetical protein
LKAENGILKSLIQDHQLLQELKSWVIIASE